MTGGSDALAALSRRTFDLVITDLSMQEMSGLEVARGVKDRHPDLPVVLLSGWAVQQDSEEVRQSGVDLVLSKPCSMDRLFEAVQFFMQGGGESE